MKHVDRQHGRYSAEVRLRAQGILLIILAGLFLLD